ncbi:MAG TPA: hypothetical protein PLF32_01745 [Bacteroidales bacterium]|nr:hypothetical protein [Bacteroidales bacterium]HOR81362.1 hypothetical protein [Bacteroidales bacterium]HPJ90840.1 hypothetical protein [Bacteroidales bacterium]
MKIIYPICLVFLLNLTLFTAQGQNDKAPTYYLHSLADTSAQSSYKEYVNFWIDFLYEENDSIRRAYWEPSQIGRFGDDYALFYNSLFQYPPKLLLNYYQPYILSIYFERDTCHIVTAFWNFNFRPNDTTSIQNSNPFAILEIGIVKKDNNFYLINLFDKRVQNWEKVRYGKIIYFIEPSLTQIQLEMEEAKNFVDTMLAIFSTGIDTITYVVCKTPQSLGYLLGFNFFYAGFTTGKTFINAKIIISGRGSFNYPHELTHIVVDPFLKPGHFLSEGMATFFGGSSNKTYQQLIKEFKNKYYPITKTTFDKINEKPNSLDAYISAALVVNIIYDSYGVEGLQKLNNSPKEANKCPKHLSAIFNANENQLFELINSILDKVR